MAEGARRRQLYREPHEAEADEILNVRAEVTARRRPASAAVHRLGNALARPVFVLALLLFHAAWIALNAGLVPWVAPFDPYPFPLLATVTSVAAPLLALLILLRQSGDARIEELREELDVQVALRTERKLTVVLRLLTELQAHLAVPSAVDPARLERLQEELDPEHLLETLRYHLDRTEGFVPDDAARSAAGEGSDEASDS